QPEEERHLRVAEIGGQLRGGVEVRFLEDVRWVHTALQTLVEANRHHAAKPVMVPLEQGLPGFGVAGGGTGQRLMQVALVVAAFHENSFMARAAGPLPRSRPRAVAAGRREFALCLRPDSRASSSPGRAASIPHGVSAGPKGAARCGPCWSATVACR